MTNDDILFFYILEFFLIFDLASGACPHVVVENLLLLHQLILQSLDTLLPILSDLIHLLVLFIAVLNLVSFNLLCIVELRILLLHLLHFLDLADLLQLL